MKMNQMYPFVINIVRIIIIIFKFQAEITTAYQEKPCLDPHDPECPTTAPNYFTKQVNVEQYLVRSNW